MLPLPESAVLTGQIRLQSENYFNKSKLNTLLSIFPLKTYFDSDSEVCRTDVAVSICTLFPFLPLFKNNIEKKKKLALAYSSSQFQKTLKALPNPYFY